MANSADTLDWERDGRDWPNRAASRFVAAGGLAWHVQVAGQGPPLLLLHGTGASTHSFAEMLPLLSQHFTVIAPDLPGHGFTSLPPIEEQSLTGMSVAVAALLRTLGFAPVVAVGHSAGAAILVRMCLDSRLEPKVVISLNGALLPFPGVAGQMFPPLARLLFVNPFATRFFAWRAQDRSAVERLIRGTGSSIPASSLDIYARLFGSDRHLTATLGMMANWDLPGLARDMPRLRVPLVLVACSEDAAIPPDTAIKVRDRVPSAVVEYRRGLGHLAHEERPNEIAGMVLAVARQKALPAAQ